MSKRERGTGGLFRYKNSKNWFAQIYKDGRPKRVSTHTPVKQEAQAFLRNLMVGAERGEPFVGDVRKLKYEDLREALIHNYVERGNKTLEVYADGEPAIWGLKAVDEFFKGRPASRITTDSAREFAQKLLAGGSANGTV